MPVNISNINRLLTIVLIFICAPVQSEDNLCWESAANRYNISTDLLKAIGYVESSHNPKAENIYSKARGILQIDDWWWPKIEKDFGITPDDLWDACTNIHVGAWILAQEIQRYGNTWTAVGAYYAGAHKKNSKDEYINHYIVYAKRVASRLEKMRTE